MHPVDLHRVGITSDRLAHLLLPDAGVRRMSSSSGRTTGFEFLGILEWALQLRALTHRFPPHAVHLSYIAKPTREPFEVALHG